MRTSGDRHLRPEPSGKLKGLIAGPRTVLVQASAQYASSFAGQVLLQLLVNLLCRQYGIVDAVWLDIPTVAVDHRAFPFAVPICNELRDQLLVLGRAVGGDEVDIEVAGYSALPSITVLVGPAREPCSDSPFTLVTYGDGWDAFCSAADRSPQTGSASTVPFGSLLTACLASGMVFRYFHSVSSSQTENRSLWNFGQGIWRGDDEGAGLDGVRLPDAHLIGLGAVGSAFGLALAVSPGLTGNLTGIDPQTTDETGRNRLLSAFHGEVGCAKVTLAARLFDHSQIHFYPNKTRWPDYVTESGRCVPPNVRAEEDAFRYEWMISCVDRNIHRQDIARYLPLHVLSGSTDGLVSQASYYSMDGACECLACNHPVPTFSLEDFVEKLQGISPGDRLACYEAWGLPPPIQAAIDEYLYSPSCGQAAEAELRRLGVEGTTDWSVGFVSAAAGVMLAAYFARCAIHGVITVVDNYPERRLIFLGAQEFSRSRAQRKPDCPVCGNPDRRQRFTTRWRSHAR